VVHDDASTDGTASIIREYAEKYPDIILPIYETENQYSKHDGSLGRIMAKAHGATMAKYIAECEGDDFWTVPYKLKKQVNFLESHPDYSMCCHNYKTIFENSTDEIFHQEETDKIICFEDVYNGEIQTATTVFRRELYQFDKYIKLKQIKNCPFGDYIVFISAMLFGKVMKFHDNMSIYRRHEGSATDLFKYHIEDFIRSHKYISNVANTEHLLNSYLSKIFMSVLIDSIKRKQNSSVALKLWSSAPLQCTQRLIRFCFNYFSFKIKHLA
jgi:glycosyltransferase involved in cell wall biosynthesis